MNLLQKIECNAKVKEFSTLLHMITSNFIRTFHLCQEVCIYQVRTIYITLFNKKLAKKHYGKLNSTGDHLFFSGNSAFLFVPKFLVIKFLELPENAIR